MVACGSSRNEAIISELIFSLAAIAANGGAPWDLLGAGRWRGIPRTTAPTAAGHFRDSAPAPRCLPRAGEARWKSPTPRIPVHHSNSTGRRAHSGSSSVVDGCSCNETISPPPRSSSGGGWVAQRLSTTCLTPGDIFRGDDRRPGGHSCSSTTPLRLTIPSRTVTLSLQGRQAACAIAAVTSLSNALVVRGGAWGVCWRGRRRWPENPSGSRFRPGGRRAPREGA